MITLPEALIVPDWQQARQRRIIRY